MEISNWMLNMPQKAAFGSGQGFSVALSGLVDTGFHAGVAEHGRTIGVDVFFDDGAGNPALGYQWATVESGDIAGQTEASLLVDAGSLDGETLFCRVTAEGIGTRATAPAIVRQVPPTVASGFSDEIFDQGSGDQQIPLAGAFSGVITAVTLPADGGIASYNAALDALIVETGATNAGATLTVRAENSGGYAEAGLTVTIEAGSQGTLLVDFDPLTAAGEGGVPVTGSAVSSGDPQGHWAVSDGLLVPSTAGDAADLDAGPYSLTLDDGQVVEVQVAPHPFSAEHWALSGPDEDGVDIVIFDLPSDSGTPLTGIEVRFNGGAWQPIGGTAPGIYTIAGLAAETFYRVELRASNGAAGRAHAQGLLTVPADPRGFRGWDPRADFGTAGDLFVAPFGSDSNAGTSMAAPMRTIRAAVSTAKAAGGTHTIKVRAGTYRERIDLPSDIILEGYGTEKPRITASEPLTNWVRCDDTDTVLSATHAIPDNGPGDRSPVFKTTVPYAALEYFHYGGVEHTDAIDKPHLAINLHEAGKRVFISKDQADMSSLFAHRHDEAFHIADLMTEGSDGNIEQITDADVISPARYTDAQLLAAGCFVYGTPNVSTYADITGSDVANNTITVDSSIARQSDSTASSWKYALFNIPAGLVRGSFAVLSDGVTLTVYLYPYDEANIEAGLIEYSPRDNILKTELGAERVEVRGFHLSQYTVTVTGYGRAFHSNNNNGGQYARNLVVENNLVTGGEGVLGTGSAINLTQTEDSVIRRNTIYFCEGVGTFNAGFGSANPSYRLLVSRNHMHTLSKHPWSWYDHWHSVFAHNRAQKTGRDAHSAKTVMYGPQGRTHDFMFWGNEYVDCTGYVVWQNASAPLVAFNWMQIQSDGAPYFRTITDDNQSFSSIPVNDTSGYIFNNTVVPNPAHPSGSHAINVQRDDSDIIYTLNNNVTAGMTSAQTILDTGGHLPPAASVRGNVITDLSGESLSDYDSSNAIQTDYTLVYADHLNDDFSPAANSPILTTPGIDMSAEIAAKLANFPFWSDWDKDYKFQTIDWADLPVGADSGLPFERQPSQGGGISLVASALAGSSDYRNSAPYGALGYTPQGSDTDLLIAVALHSGAVNVSATWRGATLPALFINTAAASTTRSDVIALFRADPGSGEGDLVVTPTGESNALTVAFLEVSGLAADAIPGAQVAAGVQAASDQVNVTATLPGVSAGNAVLGLAAISKDAGAVSAAGSDLPALPGVSQYATSAGGGLSDMTLHVQFAESFAGGSVTATAAYETPGQSAFVLAELAGA